MGAVAPTSARGPSHGTREACKATSGGSRAAGANRTTPAARARLDARLAALALAAGLGVLGLAPPAAAQWGQPSADQRARAFYEVGERHYAEGAYEQAIAQWLAAYQLSPRPLILFNIANAYERLGRVADAIDNLERYRAAAPVQEHAQLDARLANLRGRDAGGAGGEDALFAAGVGVGAAGLLLLGAGAVFAALALDTRGQIDAACREAGDARVCAEGAGGLFSDAETFALLGDLGLFGGGAVAAAGLLLAILGAASGGEAAQAALTPRLRIGPDGASAGIGGRF